MATQPRLWKQTLGSMGKTNLDGDYISTKLDHLEENFMFSANPVMKRKG